MTDAVARVARRIDRRWLVALAAIDAAFVVLHFADARFSPLQDRGFAEMFRYVETLFIVWLLIQSGKRRADRFCYAAAGLLLYVFIDDLLRLHESAGIWLTDHVALFAAAGELGHATGELAYLALVAMVWLAMAWRSMQDRRPRSVALRQEIGVVIAVLAACGLGLDFLHSLGGIFRWPGTGLLEGGGELLAFSFATAYFVALPRAERMPPK